MNTPPILVIPIGTATDEDVALCRAAGVVVLRVPDPSQVRFVEPPIREPNVVRVCVRIAKALADGNNMTQNMARALIINAVMESSEMKELTNLDPVTP